MPAPINKFKAELKKGNQQIGCWIGMANAYTAEMVTTAGFDWLLIDGEHAPNDIPSITAQLQVIQPSPSQAVVRLPIGEEYLIKQILDAGCQNILIPMVESGDQAVEMVSAVTYPPNGTRGVGSALARASHFSNIPDYLKTADEQICLLLQVENRKGIEALDDILKVDGVDGVFIGPSDLAADMGHIGNPSEPTVKKTVLDSIAKIVASGKSAGILTTDLSFAKECLDLGATFVATGIDVTVFTGAMKKLAKDSKDLIGNK